MTEVKKSSSEEKVWAVVGYLWILSLVALAARKNNQYVRFHASQGVLLFAISIVGMVLGPLGMILNIILAVAAIAGIVKAWQGQKWELPVLGGIAQSFSNWLIKTLKL